MPVCQFLQMELPPAWQWKPEAATSDMLANAPRRPKCRPVHTDMKGRKCSASSARPSSSLHLRLGVKSPAGLMPVAYMQAQNSLHLWETSHVDTSSPPCLLHPVHPHTGSIAAYPIIKVELRFDQVKAQAIPASLHKRLQASPPKYGSDVHVLCSLLALSACRSS